MKIIISALLAVLVIGAQDAVPAGDAVIDRFMAAIPDPGSDPDPEQLAYFITLNPGRDADIAPVLQSFAECRNAYAARALRNVAASLGSERLARLTAFYEGEDFRALDRITSRPEEELTAQEQAERDRIISAYPIEDFVAAMQPSNPAFSMDEAMAMLDQCERERDEALQRQGLRVSPE